MPQAPSIDVLFIAANTRSLVANRRPILEALQRRGLTVGALVPDDAFLDEVHALGVHTWPYTLDRHDMTLGGQIQVIRALHQILRQIQPRAVFAYAIKPIVFGIPAARLAGVRESYSLTTGLGYLYGRTDPKGRLLREAATALYSLAAGLNRTFFFQNPDDCRELCARPWFHALARPVVVPGSGVDPCEYPFHPAPSSPVTFLFVGRLLREKGIHDFVEAARQVHHRRPEARFVVLGDRDPTLVNAISEQDWDAWTGEGVVSFLGRVRDVRPHLRAASVVVMPSYYREGIPRALLEAMSTGRALITCDSPGCRETVEEGVNGWLVPPRSPAALADRMMRFLDRPDLIAQMGQRSRERVESTFTTERVVAQMLAHMPIAQAEAPTLA